MSLHPKSRPERHEIGRSVYWLSGASVVAVAWMIVADMAARNCAAQTRVLFDRRTSSYTLFRGLKKMFVYIESFRLREIVAETK